MVFIWGLLSNHCPEGSWNRMDVEKKIESLESYLDLPSHGDQFCQWHPLGKITRTSSVSATHEDLFLEDSFTSGG